MISREADDLCVFNQIGIEIQMQMVVCEVVLHILVQDVFAALVLEWPVIDARWILCALQDLCVLDQPTRQQRPCTIACAGAGRAVGRARFADQNRT